MPLRAATLARPALLWAACFCLSLGSVALFGGNPVFRVANAVAIVFLVRSPPRQWPALALAVAAAVYLARSAAGSPGALAASVCGTLEVLCAAGLICASGGVPRPWYLPRAWPRLLLAWLLVPAASGGIAALALAPHFTGEAVWRLWRTWYSASAMGFLIVTPLLLSWTDPDVRSHEHKPRGTRDVLALAAGALAGMALLLQEAYPPLMLLSFPLLLLMTWAYGLIGASVSLTALAAAGIWSTLHGLGSTVRMVLPATELLPRMQALQIYLATLVMSSLPFAAVLAHQRRLAEDLRRTGDARSEFLSAMSHEIRTPMTGVLGLADLLAAEPLPQRQKKYVDAMRASGRHLLAVINDILDFSRIETGRLTLEDIDFSVPDMLEQVRSLLHPQAVERGLALHFVIAPHSPPIVRGDPTRIKQILLNLVGNAVKFTAQGSVTVQVDDRPLEDGRLRFRFSVRDTGIGIAPERLAQLFEAFTQAERSTARRFGGSGLGLAISRRLAEAMGGGIEARSTPGAGSVFTLEVPLALGDERRLVRQAAEALAPSVPRRILVAEDVEINREILRAALQPRGHHVVFATDGAQAVEQVRQQPFDLILMDVQMPVMDGVEATRRIRALPGPAGRTPIIGLTANVLAQEQERYLAAGMDACQTKPIDWGRLAEAIARYGGVGDAAAAQQAAASVAPDADAPSAAPAPPLVDAHLLSGLRAVAGDDGLPMLLGSGLEATRATVAALHEADTPQERARLAHRLKGSAGTLSFLRVSALAQALEEAEEDDAARARLQAELEDALAATQAELARLGLVPAGG